LTFKWHNVEHYFVEINGPPGASRQQLFFRAWLTVFSAATLGGSRVPDIFFGGWAGPGVFFTRYQYIGTERDFWPSKGYGEEFADAKN